MSLPMNLHATMPVHSGLETFGRFIGSWTLDWSRPYDPQAPLDVQGDVHFGWVLGGRAIQDVWAVPSVGTPGAGATPFGFHGSTIRFFDARIGAWRSTWVEPVNGRVRKFVGREVDDEIHLVSLDEEPLLRWRFTEISANRFVWLGEWSHDEARTWQLEERMVAHRVPEG